MNWKTLVAALTAAGFAGDADSIAEVRSFLAEQGQSQTEVAVGEKTVSIDDLYRDRDGKPLDLSDAAAKAADEARIADLVRGEVEAIRKATGLGASPSRRPNVSVGVDRLSEDPRGGFKSFGHFLVDVKSASVVDGNRSADLDRWTKASLTTFAQEGVGADGGFAVPQEFRDQITKLVQAEPDSLMARCDSMPISRAGIALPDDETEIWGSDGVQAYWEGEADEYRQSKPSLKLKEFRLRKLTTICPVTEELLEDAPALGAYVSAEAPRRIRWKADEAVMRGSGAGQPLGFLNSDSLITVAKVNSQANGTLTGQNIIDMWTRLFAPYRQNAVWLVHQDVDPQLYKLSTTGTTAAGAEATGFGFPLFSPPGVNRDTGGFPTLLGRPVITTQHCATLGEVGDICLVALDQYRLVMKTGGIEAQQSMHLWFDQDAIAFKFRMRADGQPKLSTTITPRTGSTTMSAFVTLAARTS